MSIFTKTKLFSRAASGDGVEFISHRLASTRFCDRILLLENGTIIEQGTHDELICLNGRYAQLFEIQGKYYRVNKDGVEEVCA